MKDKVIQLLVVLVVLGAFAVGMLYGKLTIYEQGGTGGGSGTQNAAAPVGDNQPPPPEVTELDDATWQELLTDGAAVLGDESAEVTIVEFTDYQCPFCARYYTDTYSTIMSDYVDTGKVKYVFRDLPLSFHQNAKPASLAARCAGDQNKYFEMHDRIFEGQEEWSSGDPVEIFAGYAGEIGLNVSTYNSCYENDNHGAVIDADVALATKVGATGTPTFFINGSKLVGAQPTATFQNLIDTALGE